MYVVFSEIFCLLKLKMFNKLFFFSVNDCEQDKIILLIGTARDHQLFLFLFFFWE